MLSALNPVEVWCKRLNPSELYNLERRIGDNPYGGGGQLYMQVTQGQFPNLLKFLKIAQPPPLGASIPIDVKDPTQPNKQAETLEFWVKSQNRMRTGPLNRFRASSIRPSGWSPAAGFPTLQAGQKTPDAKALLSAIGGVRVFLARDTAGIVWAGFTKGAPSAAEKQLPYANIAWGSGVGGYWP